MTPTVLFATCFIFLDLENLHLLSVCNLYCSIESAVMQVAGLDRHLQPGLRDVFISAEERENGENIAIKSTERTEEERRSEGASPEANPVRKPVKEEMTVEGRGKDGLKIEEILERNQGSKQGSEESLTAETYAKLRERSEESITVKTILSDNAQKWEMVKTVKSHNTGTQEEAKYETDVKYKKSDRIEKLRQIVEERESKLVAGINLHEGMRGDEDVKMLTVKQEIAEKGNKERGRGKESEFPAAIQIITESQNPPSSPPPHSHHNVPPPFPVTPTQVPPLSSLPSTPYVKVSPQFLPPAVTSSNPTVSTAAPSEVRSVSLLEDLLIEVLRTPGHHLNQNELEVKASPNLEDERDKNMWLNPAWKELQTTHKVQKINTVAQPEGEFTHIGLNTKNPKPTPKSNENTSTARLVKLTRKPNMTQPTDKPKTVKLVENDTKLAAKQNKTFPPQPQLTRPSAKSQLTTANTPLTKPRKINRSSKNKTIRKSKEKKRKKDNKTQKPSKRKKEVTTSAYFPYFTDNYCPPECACYGR